jgi:hypothetical protein
MDRANQRTKASHLCRVSTLDVSFISVSERLKGKSFELPSEFLGIVSVHAVSFLTCAVVLELSNVERGLGNRGDRLKI